MARQIYDVNMNIMAKGMWNRLSKPCASVNENLTRCLQRYVVLGYERKRKYLFFNPNNTVLRAIPRKHNFDFHRRTGELREQSRHVPIGLACPGFVAWISSPWRKYKYQEHELYENNGVIFDFMTSSQGCGPTAIENDTETLALEKAIVNSEHLKGLVNWNSLAPGPSLIFEPRASGQSRPKDIFNIHGMMVNIIRISWWLSKSSVFVAFLILGEKMDESP
jgi:hypothetical protein